MTPVSRQREAAMCDQQDASLDTAAMVQGAPPDTGDVAHVARPFRYMRRKPTIISYKPPEDGIFISELFMMIIYEVIIMQSS